MKKKIIAVTNSDGEAFYITNDRVFHGRLIENTFLMDKNQ